MKLPSGHETIPIEEAFKKEIARKIGYLKDGCAVITPGYLLTSDVTLEAAEDVYNFKVRKFDVFVTSFPKTGSTWIQEIVWTMFNNRNLDHPDADKGSYSNIPVVELGWFFKPKDTPSFLDGTGLLRKNVPFMETYELMTSPRVFKTHLYFKLHNPDALEKAKFVYMIRDPTDTCISAFHFSKGLSLLKYPDSLEDFVDDFIAGKTMYGSYVEHLLQWWDLRNHKNVHTIFYEDLKNQTIEELKRLNEFLGTNLTDVQLENVKYYTSFSEMKKRDPLTNSKEDKESFILGDSKGFFRQGNVGSAKEELPAELLAKIKKHFRENLKDVQLPYNLND